MKSKKKNSAFQIILANILSLDREIQSKWTESA